LVAIHKYEIREQRAESSEQRAESREQRAESKEQRAENIREKRRYAVKLPNNIKVFGRTPPRIEKVGRTPPRILRILIGHGKAIVVARDNTHNSRKKQKKD
jgi:hypothetical protein